jgi:uncharacterized tellurite resistance protein B-like protein
MFFIAGTESRSTTLDRGLFFCPTCEEEQSYEHKVVKETATIFFVPVATVGELGRYIECQNCGDTFREEVLDYIPEPSSEEIEAEFRKAIKYAIVAMSLTDGKIIQSEFDVINSISMELTGNRIGKKELKKLMSQIKNDGGSVVEHLVVVAPFINDTGKELVIKALLQVAAADGKFHNNEVAMIGEAGAALDISSAHLSGIIDEYNESQIST